MKYEILGAKNDLGDDVGGKWQIINTETGCPCGNVTIDTFYNTVAEAEKSLAYLIVADDLPFCKTLTPEETRLTLLKKIIEEFNTLDTGEILDVIWGNRGSFNMRGDGKGCFKIQEYLD